MIRSDGGSLCISCPFFMVNFTEASNYISTNLPFRKWRIVKNIHPRRVDLRIKKRRELSYKELQKLDQSKNKFISIVSHELRTPMTVINGFTEFLLSEKFGELNGKQKEFLGTISRNTTELIKLVNKILDISRLESGKLVFESRDILFPEFLVEAANEFRVLCVQKNIKLTFQNPKNMRCFIKSDPFRIKRVLMNLISNSCKCTPEGGTVVVILEPYPDAGQSIQISVKDNGIGIPKEDQKYIFEKFHQVENSLRKSYTGTGLGLHIVNLIIARLGGFIWFKSTEGKGTCFTFSLPDTNEK